MTVSQMRQKEHEGKTNDRKYYVGILFPSLTMQNRRQIADSRSTPHAEYRTLVPARNDIGSVLSRRSLWSMGTDPDLSFDDGRSSGYEVEKVPLLPSQVSASQHLLVPS